MTEVLDCTLRDGGYYTDWDFTPETVRTYLHSVARLPISFVEVGYVNDPGHGYTGEFNYLTPERLREIRAELRDDQKLVVMIDGKNLVPERLPALFAPLVGLVDVVRITVAPTALEHGIALGRALKELDFQVGFNVMYLSTYQDDLKRIQPAFEAADSFDSIALVDSFGGCLPGAVTRLFEELRQLLPDKIIGFHGHDNMCLAFANTLAAIDAGADVVDGTFTGMGRGAGNLRTETVLIHRAGQGIDENLDYQALSRVIAPFEELRRAYEWGTNLAYMLSGANNLPQKDVMDWLSKNRYSVLSIIDALQQQSGGEVDQTTYDDLTSAAFAADSVLIIGGGPSVVRHADALARFVEKVKPLVLFSSARHLSLAARFGDGTQLLCLPGHDAARVGLSDHVSAISALVVPAPPRVNGCLPADVTLPVFQSGALRLSDEDKIGPVSDTGPLALALGAARALGPQTCFLAGFDGYPMATAAEQELSREVEATLELFLTTGPDIDLRSITPTRYALRQSSVYGLLAAVD